MRFISPGLLGRGTSLLLRPRPLNWIFKEPLSVFGEGAGDTACPTAAIWLVIERSALLKLGARE